MSYIRGLDLQREEEKFLGGKFCSIFIRAESSLVSVRVEERNTIVKWMGITQEELQGRLSKAMLCFT